MSRIHTETHTKTTTLSSHQHRDRTRQPAEHPAAIIHRARTSPESLSAADVLQLQRTIDNREVGRLLAETGSRQAPVQRQEVTEDGGLLQGTFTDECVQCQMPEEEEEPIQAKTLQAKAQPNRTGMPDNLKTSLENHNMPIQRIIEINGKKFEDIKELLKEVERFKPKLLKKEIEQIEDLWELNKKFDSINNLIQHAHLLLLLYYYRKRDLVGYVRISVEHSMWLGNEKQLAVEQALGSFLHETHSVRYVIWKEILLYWSDLIQP